jgi:hypothetical protein
MRRGIALPLSTTVMLIVGAVETAGCFRISSSSTYFFDDYFNFTLARIMGFTQYLGKDAYGLFVPGARRSSSRPPAGGSCR